MEIVCLYRYSFDYGSVHFIMMSTEHNFTQGSPQYEWMENDLKNVNRSLTPWIVIAGHRPMYTSQIEIGELHGHKFKFHYNLNTVSPKTHNITPKVEVYQSASAR